MSGASQILRKSELSSRTDKDICTYIQRESSLNPNSNRQHDRPAALVAQQYSFAIFVSLRFHYRKKKFSHYFKDVTISIFTTFKNFVTRK
jgi:hypothetical protein